ncbi:CvpA family protein [Denitrificimonas caeni]|uniref:CvpA family protein n=1 Tax=Denitrificimonas caeni TaxID=521720 RepID=A0AAF0AJM8_9GAMM|nr:CvpA family protein [Denitrificimonas caeni]NLJ13286.1 CvpA family protein [Gammaproteobacteria bacterium]WBE24521.1 CvpA family protein [Denitrificimonas caeni]
MSFNWVDALILGVLVISALISLSRGFIKEALSLVTWIVAGIIAWMFGGSLAHHFEPYIDTPSVRVIAACAVLFLATLLIGALVNFLLAQLVRATGLTGTDRFLGMVFGAARGLLLVVVVVGLLSLAPVQQDIWWKQSTLIPHFLLIADWSKNLVLGLSGEWISTAQNAQH